MTTITIAPVEGRRVRIPLSTEIITQEITVEQNAFWLRRVADGDLVIVKPVASPTAKKDA